MAFDLANYEPVAARLTRWLHDGNFDGMHRVVTFLEHYNDARCVFRAELWIDNVLLSTGWAEETRGDGYVNQTSHFENCETSALGRALANAGYAGSDHNKRPSREEMEKVDRALPNVVDINAAGQATTKQQNYINVLINKKGWPLADCKTFVAQTLGVEGLSLGSLSASQASTLIKALQT